MSKNIRHYRDLQRRTSRYHCEYVSPQLPRRYAIFSKENVAVQLSLQDISAIFFVPRWETKFLYDSCVMPKWTYRNGQTIIGT